MAHKTPMGWIATGASVAGIARARNADAFIVDTIACEYGPVSLLAVADGAGCAAYGHRGSRRALMAVREAARVMPRLDTSTEVLDQLRENALQALKERLTDKALLSDFHTTLLLAIVDQQSLAALQIGDGAIVVSDEGATWRPLFWPAKGSYANETWFLTSDNPPIQTTVVARPKGIALFTDGFEQMGLDFKQRTAASGLFSHLDTIVHGEPRSAKMRRGILRRVLQSEPVRRRSHDDCTLILARRDSE